MSSFTITFEKKEGRFGVLTIIVDGEPWRDIHSHIFGRKPALCAKSLTELESQFPIFEYRGALGYTLKRLALKGQPSSELIKSLKERLVSDETIHRIITECQQQGYVNDRDWVESFIRRQMAKNLGSQAILMKLKAKGVSPDLTMDILSRLDNPELQKERIRHLLETRYRTKDLSDYNTRSKVISALSRKGFSFDDIREVVSTF